MTHNAYLVVYLDTKAKPPVVSRCDIHSDQSGKLSLFHTQAATFEAAGRDLLHYLQHIDHWSLPLLSDSLWDMFRANRVVAGDPSGDAP